MTTQNTAAYGGSCGDWLVCLTSGGVAELAHIDSGARLHGTIHFTSNGRQWTIEPPRDGVTRRPTLVDHEGNVQGYLALRGDGGRLEIRAVHRCAQSYAGELRLQGNLRLGRDSFACRTVAPPASSRVVQMASGPAQSNLNDSLFDAKTDTALCFTSARTVLSDSGNGSFDIDLSACIEDASHSAIVIDLQQDYLRSRYVPYYEPINRQRCPTPPTGWMSWNLYFDTAGAEENLAEARIGARELLPFGLEFWSIESWQGNSDCLPVSTFHNLDLSAHARQFPDGMKALAEDIRALGFRPGIWTVPFGTGNHAFYESHREWFLHTPDGTPMRNWCGLYVLDPTLAAARNHMREMHRVMREEWGYEFFKIDGMSGRNQGYCAHFYERDEVRAAFHYPDPEPFRKCVEALRQGIGSKAIFLACQGHYTGPEAAYADAARIGGDIVAPNQPSTWHNIRSQASATLNQLFVHNIVLHSDPDTLLVGSYHGVEQARVTATIVALPGQMMFAGDKLAELPADRMRLLQQALPVCNVRPADLFPIFEMRPIWDLKIRRPFGQWDVVAVFNWTDETEAIDLDFAELGLPANTPYLAYEFWEAAFMGRHINGLRIAVPARSVRLLALHRDKERPQFLSTDRHITQGGTSLEALDWDDGKRVLSGRVHVIEGHPTRLSFHVPEPFSSPTVTAGPGVIAETATNTPEILDLTLSAEKRGSTDFALRW